MRQKHTVGEWMELIDSWERDCEHGSPKKICTTCAGALHPALSATVRHLRDVLNETTNQGELGKVFRLLMETDGTFSAVAMALEDLIKTESSVPSNAPPPADVARRELTDVRIIAGRVRELVSQFERLGIADIRSHEIVTGIRQPDTLNS
jgi:hypothetical protein